MKKILFTILSLFITISAFAQHHRITFSRSTEVVQIADQRADGLVLNFTVGDLDLRVQTSDGRLQVADGRPQALDDREWTHLSIDGFDGSGDVGSAQLPYTSRFFAVPQGATVNLSQIFTEATDVSLAELGFTQPIYPAQPHYKKSADMSKVEFVYDEKAYQKVKETLPVQVNEIGYMRGQRVFEVVYQPITYNPITKSIKVYYNIEVEIDFINSDFAETEYYREKTWSPDFERIYQSYLINYTPLRNRDALMRIPTKYVIISHPTFIDAMQPFIEWKTQQGFEMIVKATNDPAVGSTTTSIKAYLQGLWNAATPESPAPTYLLFVGDVAQIPAFPYTANEWGASDPHITDLSYVRLQGTDYLPEMYYGRFSANNLTELTPQIEKTLMYQKYTMSDPSYLGKALLIAGNDRWSATQYCNGQINYMTTHYFNSNNGYPTTNVYLYSSTGTYPTSTIRSQISEGRGWINYTAHGFNDEWSDPLVNVDHINNLTNSEKYSIAIGNCCLSSAFDTYNSFAESWLRKANGGGVIYIGATNSTSWDPDYRWAVGNVAAPSNGSAVAYNANQLGMYDMLFHTHNEPVDKWYTTAGAMVYSGNLAMQAAGSYGNTMKNMYWEIYCIMGDPSLIPYLGVPEENIVSYQNPLFIGQSDMVVEQSAPYARVALSLDGELIAMSIADEYGVAILNFPALTSANDITLTITAQNHQPVIESIPVIATEGAYLTLNSAINVETADNSINYASQAEISVTLKNVGVDTAENVTLTMQSASEYVEIISQAISVGDIEVTDSYIVTEPFIINVSSNAPDRAIVELFIIATAGDDVWEIRCPLVINAPKVIAQSIEVVEIIDSNANLLSPGDTALIGINFKNEGHLTSEVGELIVQSLNPLVEITLVPEILDPLNPNEVLQLEFMLTINEEMPNGTTTMIPYFVDFGYTQLQGAFTLPIGQIIEDFETGDFTKMAWQHSGNANWTIVSSGVYQGNYSARSGVIGNSQNTTLSIVYNFTTDSTIQFALRTSTERNFDMLSFSVGSAEMGSWSGTTAWTVVNFDIPAGNHTLSWKYSKDWSQASGSDAVWIDNIVFPPSSGQVNVALAVVTKNSIDFGNIEPNQTASEKFYLINYGNVDLTGNIVLPANLTLNEVLNFSIPANQSKEYIVSFTSDTEGDFNDHIIINSNDHINPQITINVTATVETTSDSDIEAMPLTTQLYNNYPNPFNPSTTIEFGIRNAEIGMQNVTIDIYNIKGQKVRSLVNSVYPAGNHRVVWNGTDDSGKEVSSGIYFYKMKTNDFVQTKKMILMK